MRQRPRTNRLAPWGLAVAVGLSLVVTDRVIGRVSLGTAIASQGELLQGSRSPVVSQASTRTTTTHPRRPGRGRLRTANDEHRTLTPTVAASM